MHEILSKRLQMPVNQLYAEEIPVKEDIDWSSYQHTLLKAFGMALRGLHRSRYAQINLRKGSYAFKGDLQFLKERLGSIFVGAAVLLLLLFVSTFTQFSALSSEKLHLQKEVQKRCRKILGRPISSPLRCLLIMEDEITKVTGKKGKALIPKISAYDIFLAVYDRVGKLIKAPGPTKVKVQIGSIRITPNRFEIEGSTDSYPSVDKIHESLKAYPCFKNMKKGRVRRTSDGKKVEFRLNAEISC
jgi:general secretion pathway protein L